ncbi:uncharacterized protein [Spinacia oleracea]|uniref:Reverse transcriptase zinc-binding domain-containing protein n=1 Tax=Spinacia oleracea TaxID=3562 RepID=A0ABM3R8J5_SPIOL|nr:uncharacterized protein LOC130467449 [Spinacia oleracea]
MVCSDEAWEVSIKLMYQKLSGTHAKVPWRRLTCHNQATPKSLFILWVNIWKRLPTLDRLLQWNIVSSSLCPMCQVGSESLEHMFFDCQFSAQVWQKVLKLLQFARRHVGFTDELRWVLKSCKRGGNRHKLLRMFFDESVYSLWLNRNNQVYNKHCKSPTELFR